MKITYLDPMADHTPNVSTAWYSIWRDYLSFHIEVKAVNSQVPVSMIERNNKDGGRAWWDTPKFAAEVDKLISLIRQSDEFTAVLLLKGEGKYTVIDGHHRISAWTKMELGDMLGKIIPAVIVTTTPVPRIL
jgi:hypothetical protein